MLVATHALRLLAFAFGIALHTFLAFVLVRKRNSNLVERVTLAVVVSGAVWHGTNALALLIRVVSGNQNDSVLRWLDGAAMLAAVASPCMLLHLSLLWAGLKASLAAFTYLAALLGGWALAAGNTPGFEAYFVGCVMAAAGLSAFASRRQWERLDGRFQAAFAASLLLFVVGSGAGPDSAAIVVASLAPPLCFGYFVYRFNLGGLLIGRRVLFSLTLAAVSAVYLLAVKLIADTASNEIGALGSVVEVVLILAAAVVWLPLYAWITRVMSKRTELYTDFGKRVIEEAVPILDLGLRLDFLARGVGKTFHLRRVLLVATGEHGLARAFGCLVDPRCSLLFQHMERLVRTPRIDMAHVDRTEDSALRDVLEESGFKYLFPLWYEDRLTGLLLIDPSPRVFLDDYETILLGLSRQISHSIEAWRSVEEKIGLEKTLLAQEHLAALGMFAATIAHEVKNPLSSIRALAQLLGEDPEVSDKYGKDVSYIISETDRLNGSVRQLLTFSRPAPEGSAPVDISQLLEDVSRVLSLEHSDQQIRIVRQIEPGLFLKHADRQSLQQIVLNLTLNAIQASSANGVVQLDASSAEGKVAIAITDGGPGIAPELRNRVFEPFFTTKQKGTGLGLAIVKKNMHSLGGDIRLESPIADGRGTRITVSVPIG